MVWMLDIENTVLILVIILVISFSSFFGFIGTASSVNDTNPTHVNVTKITKIGSSGSTTGRLMAPAAAKPSKNSFTYLSVTPSTLDLGPALADNSKRSYPAATTIETCAGDFNSFNSLNLYVQASGAMSSGTDTIPVSNLKYDGFGDSSLQKTSFTTAYHRVTSWKTQYNYWYDVYYVASGISYGSGTIYLTPITTTANNYLTVPFGTSPGTYQVNITYLAIFDTVTQPI